MKKIIMPYKDKEYKKIKNNEYYYKNKKIILNKMKIYYLLNREQKLQYQKEYKSNNKKKIIEYRKINKEKIKTNHKEYCKINKKQIKEQSENYYQIHKKEIMKNHNKYLKKKRLLEVNFKLLSYLRTRLSTVLKNNTKSAKTKKLIGCTVEFFKKYLAKKFTKGMTWNNYGKWHIDHIKPCCSFNLSKANEQLKCFNYSNLQLLWAIDNIKKGDKQYARI